MAGGRDFNRGRVTDLVLYLGQHSSTDEGYGMTKLNKLLYRADTEAFRLLGESITGATYQKQELGPVLSGLQGILEDMAGQQLVEDVPEPLMSPDMRKFSPVEIDIIDAVLRELAKHGGKSVSDWSHEEWAGWRITPMGEPIPYELTVIASEPGPPKTVERLRQRVLAGKWD